MVQIDWDVAPHTWTLALSQCPGATFFHTECWLQTVQRTFGCRVARVRAVLPDGQWALLPLTIRPLAKGILPMAVAGETGAYSGFVSPAPLSAEAEALAYAEVRKRYPDLWVMGNPFAAGAPVEPTLSNAVASPEATHVLPLKPLADMRAGFSRGCKSRGNKARKAGLTMRMSTDPADAQVYYAIYEDTVKRWGEKLTWARPLAFFAHLMEDGAPAVRLFIAEDGDRPVSALLFAAYGEVAHYIAGATLSDALPLCPSNFLMEEALAFYAARGYKAFDFGPSNGLEGVIQFKESFGAQPVAFGSRRANTLAGKLYFALRRPYERLTKAGPRQAAPTRETSQHPRPAAAGI